MLRAFRHRVETARAADQGATTQVPRTTSDAVPAYLTDLLDEGAVTPDALAKTALRYEYVGAERLLAHAASAGRRTLEEVIASAGHPSPDVVADLRAPGLYALAYLTLGRPTDASRVGAAADLFDLARTVALRDGSPLQHAQLDLQAHIAAGRRADVRGQVPDGTIDPWVLWAADVDRDNPFSGRSTSGLAAWHTAFNAPFVERGIAPMTFVDDGSPFDSVTTAAVAGSVDGPTVSIVMPVFKPSESLLTAVRSLLDQTWRHVEVILVDDASPAGFEDVFDRVRALDDRVRYERMPVNGGAYRARNRGISLAQGEFVGIQDGDDWSHPQRLERQMQLFVDDPALVATLSKAVRLHNDLLVTKVGSLPFNKNAPSLLFRRELVLDRLGLFDEMRKAADTEFIERLAAAFGRSAVVTLDEPLSLYQLTDGSLSREDFRLSWHRDARVSYHGSFRHWHRQVSEDGASAVVEGPAGRAFPAPHEFLGTPYPASGPDVVVLADWRTGPVTHAGLPAQVAALAAAGLDVGLARADAPRFSTPGRHYAPAPVQQLLADGRARWTPLGAPVSPRLLVVHDTDLLTMARDPAVVALRPGRVAVVADRLPQGVDGTTLSYDPAHVEDVVRTMFGTATEWLPTTAEVAAALAAVVDVCHPPSSHDVIEVRRSPGRRVVGDPVVGLADPSPFGAQRLDRAGLASVLPAGPGYDVRVLEPSSRDRGHSARGWLAFDPSVVTPSEFFDQCDVVVGLAPAVTGANLSRTVVEAMARGCVPVVDATYRPVLGDAALYLDAGTVQQHVDALVDDPAAFAERQLRAVRFCEDGWSAERFGSTITTLLAGGPQ